MPAPRPRLRLRPLCLDLDPVAVASGLRTHIWVWMGDQVTTTHTRPLHRAHIGSQQLQSSAAMAQAGAAQTCQSRTWLAALTLSARPSGQFIAAKCLNFPRLLDSLSRPGPCWPDTVERARSRA